MRITKTVLLVISVLTVALLASVATTNALSPVFGSTSQQTACTGLSNALGTACADQTHGGQGSSIITNLVNMLSILIGIVALAMIVFAGFKYVTAAGDASKVGSAKTTLIYAIIGLFVVALAQLFVNVVLSAIK